MKQKVMLSLAVKHTGDRANIVIDLNVVKKDGGAYCHISMDDDVPGIPDDFMEKYSTGC